MTIRRTIRAEVAKATSLRLPTATAAATIALVVGLAWMLTWASREAFADGHPEEVGHIEPGSAITLVLRYGQVGIILFGSWLMAQEHEPGALRTSLLSIPLRGRLFAAKCAVAGAGSFIVALAAVGGAVAARAVLLEGRPLTASGAEDLRVIAGYLAYWTLLGTLTVGLSALLRNALAALGALLGMVLVLSPLLLSRTPLARFLPDQAGAQMYLELPAGRADLGPAVGLLVLLLWTGFVLTGGALSFRAWPVRS